MSSESHPGVATAEHNPHPVGAISPSQDDPLAGGGLCTLRTDSRDFGFVTRVRRSAPEVCLNVQRRRSPSRASRLTVVL